MWNHPSLHMQPVHYTSCLRTRYTHPASSAFMPNLHGYQHSQVHSRSCVQAAKPMFSILVTRNNALLKFPHSIRQNFEKSTIPLVYSHEYDWKHPTVLKWSRPIENRPDGFKTVPAWYVHLGAVCATYLRTGIFVSWLVLALSSTHPFVTPAQTVDRH